MTAYPSPLRFTRNDVFKLAALIAAVFSMLFIVLIVTGGIGWAQDAPKQESTVQKTTAGKADKLSTVTCPDNKPCKIITVTDDEEKALSGPNMIFDTAYMGRPLDVGGAVAYFRKKLLDTPVTQPEPKKAEQK